MVRKLAISNLHGECAIFLDGDDRLASPTALEQACLLMTSNPETDIIRFATECIGESKEQCLAIQKYLNSGEERIPLTAGEYLAAMFVHDRTGWNIWNRVYRASVLKKALPHIPNEYFIAAEDAFLSFLFAQNARQVLLLGKPCLYTYRLGSGISTGVIQLEKYVQHYAREVRVIGWMEAYAHAVGREALCRPIIDATLHRLLVTQAWRLNCLPQKDRTEGFKALLKEGYFPELIGALREVNASVDQMAVLAESLKEVRFPCQTKPVKTVGLLYWRYFHGGVERVISLLMPLYKKLGFQVVLFTEEIAPEKEYPLPEGVKRVQLPQCKDRAKVIADAVRRYEINRFVLFNASDWNVFWDLLLLRLLGVPTVLTLHEMPFQDFTRSCGASPQQFAFDCNRPHVYRFANRITCLSRTVADYYRLYGVNAQFVPNPMTYVASETSATPDASMRRGVCWIGRLDEQQKNFQSMLQVFKRVVDLHPDCQCIIAGSEHSSGAAKQVQGFIRDNNLEKQVHWKGEVADIASLLKQSRVMLMTSRFETYPMVLTEAKASGTPVVMYELPYLELVRAGGGIEAVPQENIELAAQKISALLIDDALCNKRITEQVKSLRDFYQQFDLETIWEEILQNPDNGAPEGERPCAEALDVIAGFLKGNLAPQKGNLVSVKRCYHARAMKYLILGKLALTKAKRRHYREKLVRYLGG